MVASCNSAFCSPSPACNEGTVDEGEFLSRVTISVAAWRKKSSNLTFGKGTVDGNQSLVGTLRTP